MSYIGQQLPADVFSGFTTDSFTGDGSATTFTLSKAPFSEDGLIVVINNVIQKPTTNFTVSGTTLTIVGTAVADGDVLYAIHTSGAVPSTLASKVDVNGLSDGIILDADADTTISADTDDQIDFKVGGNDTHVFDANGHITLKQFLDATTAGGRITGASNRGSNARVNLYQTAGSSDGGEIRLETANTSNSMTEAVRIHNNQVMSASAGVALGVGTANTSSNVLDDYEEGTWTPTLSGTSSGASGVTYSYRLGWYEKIGHNVTAHCWLDSASMSSVPTGVATITGLPFTTKNISQFWHSCYIGYCNFWDSDEAPQTGHAPPNATYISLYTNDSNDGRDNLNTGLTAQNCMSGNEEVMLTISYRSE